MFCMNCGKENVNGTSFCLECGAPLAVANKNGSNAAPSPKKSNKMTIGIIIGIAVVAVIAIVIFVLLTRGASSPQALVEKYVTAFNSKNVKKIESLYPKKMKDLYKMSGSFTGDQGSFLQDFDELCTDYSNKRILRYEINDIESADLDSGVQLALSMLGFKIKNAVEMEVRLVFADGDSTWMYFYAVETKDGWFLMGVD